MNLTTDAQAIATGIGQARVRPTVWNIAAHPVEQSRKGIDHENISERRLIYQSVKGNCDD
jgi:hypothetical protein